eukprot:TRINITY_DN1750_c0_g1_i1.p1 TRINITY_DN1750_c0_g1~~TRINITY_DN1750_c0_g1_i1.p1  ORF type:complete len:404 (+),score=67.07 TRINITY_DN1750_c0_g1_i1:156-1367(+)
MVFSRRSATRPISHGTLCVKASMLHLLFFLATCSFLEAAGSAAPGQTRCTDPQKETTCASTASDLPADGRGLLQMASEKPASRAIAMGSPAPSAAPQESLTLPVGRWHSLLQSWASRIADRSYLQARLPDLGPTLLTVFSVACCLIGCMGIYVGSMMSSSGGRSANRRSGIGAAEQRTLTGPLLTVQKQPRPDSTQQAQYETLPSVPDSFFYICPRLVVPSGVNSMLLLNYLEPKPGACADKVLITDQQGSAVLSAYIDRPSPGTIPKNPVVTLMKGNNEEVAKCFLRPGKNGRLLFELCSTNGRACAVLSIDKGLREEQWTLRGASTANSLYITGKISKNLTATIRDGQGELKAEAEPVVGTPLRAKVRVYSGVDSGMVLCSLLGMGELVSSGQLSSGGDFT